MTNVSNKDIIDWAHAQLHYGNSFMVNVVDDTMGDTDTLIIAFKTGATKKYNMVIDYIVAVGLKIEVFEGCAWTTSTGSKRTIFNRNRQSSKTSLIQEDTTGTFGANSGIAENVTGLNGGIAIRTLYAWGEKKGTSAISRGQREIILNTNTKYAIKTTAVGDSNKIQITLDWYED